MAILCLTVAGALGLLWSEAFAAEPAAAPSSSLPQFEQVRTTVNEYFRTLPEYEAGGVLTRKDVQPLFARLQAVGWTVADREAILAQVPQEGDFLVQQLRTPEGRKFASRIAAYPDGYDRLERLSRIPNGKTTVRDLVRSKGGDKLIEYLATTPGGAEMGKMLSKDPRGAKFNQPTGKIYTAAQLLARLKQSYAAAGGTASDEPAAPAR